MSAEQEDPKHQQEEDEDDEMFDMDDDEGGEAGEGGQGIELDDGKGDTRCQLLVRFAVAVPPLEEVKALHPHIIRVTMTKQRKPKFCFLTFATPTKAKDALEELSSKPYKNQGHLNIEPRVGKGTTRKDPKKWLAVHGFPDDAKEEEMQKEFLRYGVYHCHLYKKDVNDTLRKGTAKMIFNTVKDSEAFMNDKAAHVYKGHQLTVEFLKTKGAKRHEKNMEKRRRRKEKRAAYDKEYKQWSHQNQHHPY